MDSSFAAGLLTYGPLGLFTVLLLIGWVVPKPMVDVLVKKLQQENDALRIALDLERKHSDAGIAAATTTNELIAALRNVAEENRRSKKRPDSPDLTGKDIGIGS